MSSALRPRTRALWIPLAALGLPCIVAIASGVLMVRDMPPGILLRSLLAASINGPLEELSWRRAFRANSNGGIGFELFGLFLFTLWHVPLYLTNGVSFDHGAIGLVGGSAVLGGVWLVMTRGGDSVGWPMISHALVNAAAFIPHFAGNFGAMAR